MNTPKVAVLMTVYKNDNTLLVKEAIDSIIFQSYKNICLFLGIDGPIPDDLREFILSIDCNNEKLKITFFDKNRGLACTLNDLITQVLEDKLIKYIARMDSDDISYLSRVDKQVSLLESKPEISVCGTSCREFGASFALEAKHLPQEHNELIDFSVTRCPLIHPTVMFRVEVFKGGIRYPVDTALTEDMALWFILLVQGYQFYNINEVLLDYRLNESTISRRNGFNKGLSEFSIRIKYMFKLKRVNLKNSLLIISRLLFHLMPLKIMAYAYKNAR
ncbi:glycosyltransferase [Pseudoalteromonas sp. NZS11]|uniref:glycosyltransferase n=1 Tax=Pseudoalteromonas sp. NZS11 TaxID=2792049 RepID=UPI0018CC9093|nr:glycosyltransferase [Pseudoalteromonas sp. NZS11]MBH0078187.1 glycosyltransferase [Pseudoalteromonas sp. NZS11]